MTEDWEVKTEIELISQKSLAYKEKKSCSKEEIDWCSM